MKKLFANSDRSDELDTSDGSVKRTRQWFLNALFFLLVLSLVHFWSSGWRDALIWGSFLVLIGLAISRRRQLKINSILIAAIAYTGLVLISVLYSRDGSASFHAWFKLAELVAGAFVVAQLVKSRESLAKVLLYVMLALTAIYLYDIIIYMHGLLTAELTWGERWNNPAHYNQPNIYSALIVSAFPIAYYLFRQYTSKLIKAAALLHATCGLFLVYVLASRAAQVALVGMIAVAVLASPGWKRKAQGAALVLLLIGVVVALNPRFLDATVVNLHSRTNTWSNTVKLIEQRPLQGYGYGENVFKKLYNKKHPHNPERIAHPHNVELKVLFENGIVGLIFYLSLWVLLAIQLIRGLRAQDTDQRRLYFIFLLAFSALFIYFQASVPNGINQCWFWFLTGAVAAMPQTTALRKNVQ